MSRDGRKPWETPIVYNEDRFVERTKEESPQPFPHHLEHGASDNGEVRDASEIEEILRRPDHREEREYECNDTTPINYKKGPHDEEFGVEDHDFDQPDNVPLNYEQGPHDEEFGVEDDEEFEPLDGTHEFDEEV
jgi:hypothetical protein